MSVPPADSPVRAAEAVRLRQSRHRAFAILSLAAGLVLFILWLPPEARAALLTNLLTNRTLVGLLLFFGLLALSLLWSQGQRLDAWMFLAFNLRGRRPAWMDRAMWVVTQLGNMAAAFAAAAIFFFNGNRRLAAEIVLGLLTLWLAVELIKALTDRARPFIALANARVIGWREPGLSFPSGHTAQVFFLLALLAKHFQPGLWGTLALLATAVAVGITRLYVGAHYPRDVIAGAVLGWVWGLLILLVSEHIPLLVLPTLLP